MGKAILTDELLEFLAEKFSSEHGERLLRSAPGVREETFFENVEGHLKVINDGISKMAERSARK